MIDNLSYTYIGNQVQQITDKATAQGYPLGASAYSYDANGNITKEGATQIAYNLLNLPSTVTLTGGRKLFNSYAADGRKLSTVSRNEQNELLDGTKTYNGNLVFDKNLELEYILFPEGRILNKNANFVLEYHLKDHLGSVRVAFEAGAAGNSVVQENAFYPSGSPIDYLSYNVSLSTNRYKRESKEYISDFGWNKYDYGARTFDSWILRSLQIDPLAGKYHHVSAYALWNNNPMRYTDPDGKDIWDKVVGWAYGIIDNITGSNFRSSYVPNNASDYNNSLTGADITSIGIGAVTAAQGSTMVGGGLVAAPATGGVSLVGSAVGALVTAEGAYMATNAVKNLGSGNNYENNNSEVKSEKKTNPKREAREKGKAEKENQPASEQRAKWRASELEKAEGPGARRRAHDAKEKGAPDRTKKQIDEDYKINK